MTPIEIIEQVKLRFDAIYIEEQKLEQMMKDSMGVFQDRAGAIKTIKIVSPDTSVEKPIDFLMVAATADGNGLYTEFEVTDTDIELSGTFAYPVTISYLVNFRELDIDDDLPPESIGLIQKHFAACLARKNTTRERNLAQAAGLQRELPTDETLSAEIKAVETDMDDAMAIIPMSTVA